MKVTSIFYGVWAILKIIILFPVVFLWPRSRKKIVFGAWFGTQYADNPKYFMHYLLSLQKGFKCVWVGNENVRHRIVGLDGVEFARKGSWLANWHVLTAKWLCCCIDVSSDVTTFPTFGRMKQLNFWHGTAYKGMSAAVWPPPVTGNIAQKICRWTFGVLQRIACPQACFASFSYKRMCRSMANSEPWSFAFERSIAAGTPRIDYLVNNARNAEEIKRVRTKYARMLGLPMNKKWYLYMPTFRKGLALKFSFMTSKRIDDYQKILAERNAVIVEKQHPQVIAALGIRSAHDENIYEVSAEMSLEIDTQELLLAADGLITDYSACFCDFMVLDRPIVHFAYDYDWYVNIERGVEFDLRDVAGGPMARNEEELLSVLSMSSEELLCARGKDAGILIECEKGKACETFAKYMGLI